MDLSHYNVINGVTHDKVREERVQIAKIPIMLKSANCHLSEKSTKSLREMDEDVNDPGGYFIVNGGEKAIIMQERLAENKVYVFKATKQTPTGSCKIESYSEIKSSIDQRFYPIKTMKVRLCTQRDNTVVLRTDLPRQFDKKSQDKGDIPVFVIFRLLGVTTDQDIIKLITSNNSSINNQNNGSSNTSMEYNYEKILIDSAEDARKMNIFTYEDALKWISSRIQLPFGTTNIDKSLELKKKYVLDSLDREIFPHVGLARFKKAVFLAYMTKRLLDSYIGIRPYDDRDHYSNKRVDLSGPLLAQIFRKCFLKLTRDIKHKLSKFVVETGAESDKLYPNIRKLFQNSTIDTKIKQSLATGNWNLGMGGTRSLSKKGVAQVLFRMSYTGTISMLRRVQSPIEAATAKNIAPRKLHCTQFGMTCANETPESKQIGVLKHICLTTHITNLTSAFIIYNALSMLDVKMTSEIIRTDDSMNSTTIILNGDITGFIPNNKVNTLYGELITLRRHNVFPPYISISWYIQWNEIVIQTDGGRYIRPVYIVETTDNKSELLIEKLYNKKKSFRKQLNNGDISWEKLLQPYEESDESDPPTKYNGAVIEYLDTNELDNSMIAINKSYLDKYNPKENEWYLRYTHCEINPILILGTTSSSFPFTDHNQSPRNLYQSCMAKQALGLYALNYNQRFDTQAHLLLSGNIPLVQPKTLKYMNLLDMPHGCESIVMVANFSGFNQEDSLIIHGSAMERGFFNSIFYRTYKDEEKKHKPSTNYTEAFSNPVKEYTRDYKTASYDAIQPSGVPKIGARVKSEDVIIGKKIEFKEPDESGFKYKDVSTIIRYHESGIVDKVIPEDDNELVTSTDGHRLIKVRVSQYREPKLGDKFASRMGQKGTVGMSYRTSDLPFTASGIYPDFIMNPHAFPSRMTIGQFMEMVLGRISIYDCRFRDGTSFQDDIGIIDYLKTLEDKGIGKYVEEVTYDGRTGDMYKVPIFIGSCYYQRLKHMVDDKVYSRESGPVNILTRQPAEGRSRQGGLKLGEMERDCLIAHGVTTLLKGKMADESDLTSVYVSKAVNDIIVGNKELGMFKRNGNYIYDDEVVEIQIPTAMKLLWQELNSAGTSINIYTS